MNKAVSDLKAACDRLAQGRFEEAAELAAAASSLPPAVREGIRATALGLVAERSGDLPRADDLLAGAWELGIPIPALLEPQARFFERRGEDDRVKRHQGVGDDFRPSDLFGEELSPEEIARASPWLMSELVSRPRPHHWFYPPIKAALVDRLGVEAAAAAFAQMAGTAAGDVVTVPLTSLGDFARADDRVYEELSPSRSVRVPDLPVFGEPWDGFDSIARALFFCVLDDVVVSSKSNLLLTQGRALLDYQRDELRDVPLEFDVDPTVFAEDDGSLTVLIESGAVDGPSLDRAFSMVGVNSYNFGHWLVEFLPKVWACRERPGFEAVPILVDEQIHPQLIPALQLFVGADHPTTVLKRGTAIRVRELWACSSIVYFPFSGGAGTPHLQTVDADAFATLVTGLEPSLAAVEGGGHDRVYVSRRDTQHRRLVNRDEVEQWFRSNGFEIVNFGELTFVEQLRLIRGADLVAGPDGSGMWNAFLARPGTRVGYLNHPHLENHWWIASLHRSLAHHLSILVGAVTKEHSDPTKSDYRIEVANLPAFVEELSSR